jgi:hypothetical protein
MISHQPVSVIGSELVVAVPVPLEVIKAGYPRERCKSGSGVPPKGVPQGALYIREWCGGTPLYERRVVIRGGPSAPEGGTPGSAVYPGVVRGNPAI